MKKEFLGLALLVSLWAYSQEKRSYKDIAYDYIMQNIESDNRGSWKIVSDKYDKMPNGGYLVTISLSRTIQYYERGLVNNQVSAYGAVFNVGVREGLVSHKDEQTRRYVVFADKYGTAHNLVLSHYEPHFHYWNNNVLVTNKGRYDDKNWNFDCNFSCYSYNGDLLWTKDNVAVFSWEYTKNTLYLVGVHINDYRSFVGTVDARTFEFKEKVGNSNVIPFSVKLQEDGVKIEQRDEKSNITSYTIPYAANDREYQIERVLKKYDLTKTSDQVALGERYLKGDILDKDIKKAVELFGKAASQNSDVGLFRLGECYKDGVGVDVDKPKASSLFEQAAIFGNMSAMLELSEMYAEGDGIETNIGKALFWKEKLAFKGDKNAQKYIMANQSIEYEKTEISASELVGIAKDSYNRQSFEWAKFCYERAVSNGNEMAMYDYGKWLYEGKGIERDCNRAIELLSKVGEGNNVEAQKLLAKIYKENNGVIPNAKSEIYWTSKAAGCGDAEAQVAMANAYKDGINVKKNKELAFSMYEKAANLGNQDAIKAIVYSYALGDFTKKDKYYSVIWFEKIGDAEKQLEIADRLLHGNGIKKCSDLAVMMYNKMSDKGNIKATKALALCYLDGLGIDRSVSLAYELAMKVRNTTHDGSDGDIYYIEGAYYESQINRDVYGHPNGRIAAALEAYNRAKNCGNARAAQAISRLKAKWGMR